jgi:two-component system OmpR family response regulator
VLRRVGTLGVSDGVLECGDLALDDDSHRVTRRGQEIELSPTEFNLLRFLMENEGRVMSKAQILDNVWDFDFQGESSIVETYIGYLRRKVDVAEPKLIRTIRGVGYTLRVSV